MSDGHHYVSGVTLVGTSDPAALTVAGLPGNRGAVLFTRRDSLSSDTVAEIARLLGPKQARIYDSATIRIIGDTNAVSAGIQSQLNALGYTTARIADSHPIAAELGLQENTEVLFHAGLNGFL